VLDDAKARIDVLTTARKDLATQLLRIKFSGGGGGGGGAESDAVDAALRSLAQVRRRAAERRGKLAKLEGLLTRMQAGLEHLASKFTEDLRVNTGSDAPLSLRASEPVERMAAAHPAAFCDAGHTPVEAAAADASGGEGGGGGARSVTRARRDAWGGAGGDAVWLVWACADRLGRVMRFLEEHAQGLPGPPPRPASARVVPAGAGCAAVLPLDPAPHNARVRLDSSGAAAAQAEWGEEGGSGAGEEVEDRPVIKARADRLVARRRRELAARFDDCGNPSPARAGPHARAARAVVAASPTRTRGGGAAERRLQ
jgi:hypothetical protein